MIKPIIGQEAICPHGLGRVVRYGISPLSKERTVTISTYIDDRQYVWSKSNVKLIPVTPLKDINDSLQTIISQLDMIYTSLREN